MFTSLQQPSVTRPLHTKSQKGFTLVELMITLVILGVIASIAIPTYQHIVKRLRRADVIAAIITARDNIERCKQNDGRSFNGCLQQGGNPLFGNGLIDTNAQYYNVTIQLLPIPAAATNYMFTAVPRPGTSQVHDTDCAVFTIDMAGARTSVNTGGVANPECW